MSSSDEQKTVGCSEKPKGDTESVPKVHSANAWEAVDLGDEDRKKKFLRLMGAAKTEHRGKFVIGDKEPAHIHARAKDETEHLNKDLEDQFNYSNEHKITRWAHTGLGFDDKNKAQSAPPGPKEPEDEPEEKEDEESEQSSEIKDGESSSIEKADTRKRESSKEAGDAPIPPKKPKMLMSFVKASD